VQEYTQDQIGAVIKETFQKKRYSLHLPSAEAATECQISTRTLRMIEEGKHPKLKTNKQKLGWARSLTRAAKFCGADPMEWCKPYGLEPVTFAKETKSFHARKLLEQGISVEDLEYLVTVAKGLPNPMTIKMMLNIMSLRKGGSPS
jgi:transcriptional regulator with XRE-family HTH domain